MSQDALHERQFRNYTMRYHPAEGLGSLHMITAHTESGQRVGRLRWGGPSGTIEGIGVVEKHQRRGVATAMWNWGQEMEKKPTHSRLRTREGGLWARSVGGELP